MTRENVSYRDQDGYPLFVDCPHADDGSYAPTTGLDLTADYNASNTMRGFLVTDNGGSDASGNIDVTFKGGGRMVVPYTVPAGYHAVIFSGCEIATIHSSVTTTFSGKIFPLF